MDIVSLSHEPSEFHDKQNTLNDLLAINGVTWGVPPLITSNLEAKRIGYNPLFSTSVNKATKSEGNTALRDTYMNSSYYKEVEYVYTEYLLNNPAIAADDRIALGIHLNTPVLTLVPDPGTTPILMVTSGEELQMIVTFRNPGTGRYGKPPKTNFLDLRYKIGAPAPISVSEADHEMNISRSGTIILFNDADRGKQVFFFGRWINAKGGAGSYCKVFIGPTI